MGNFLGMLLKAVASLDLSNVFHVVWVGLNPFSSERKRPAGSRYLRYTRDFLKGGDIEVGEFTYGIPKVYGFRGRKLKIGKFCAIASEVVIVLGENHRTDWISTYPFMVFPDDWAEAKDIKGHPSSKGDVIIGNDVWIGYGAFIISGVRIGDGASIGARAVVTSDVEPYSIVAGNPARLIRKRFDEQTISKLLETKWWDWPIEKIHSNVGVICSDDVPRLVQIH